MEKDAFQLNIDGAENLVNSNINKTSSPLMDGVGELTDTLSLDMDDEKLLDLQLEWQTKYDAYYPKVKARQEQNKLYYSGKQKQGTSQGGKVVGSNLIFESEETFIPQALSKNPEPVVWSDNTEEGKSESNKIKTMLQYHADILCLRKKLGVMVRHWSIYFIGIVKHGWDEKSNDIYTDLRKPKDFILDPDGYVDEFGDFKGEFLGEKIKITAKKLIELFPEHQEFITLKVDDKLGTTVQYIEWWTNDYCFSIFQGKVLDKHKNQYFNYEQIEQGTDEFGLETQTATPAKNHFAIPKMPYTFLSVFSLQEHPHDETNLIEQNIPNQDDINDQDSQVSRNLRMANNSIALNGLHYDRETARQAARALEDGDPVLDPSGNPNEGIVRFPAPSLPGGILQSLQMKKDTLRGIFGTQGLSAQGQGETQTARGMILNQSHDSTRVGGGIGDALEQVADNIFNWWLQLYYVFYDEPHYAAIMGNGRAVEYVQLINTDINRNFVVSVSAGSMKPKDEVNEMNIALDMWNKGALDPITLFQRLDFADPMEAAKKVVLWKTNPMGYMQTYFPEQQPLMPLDSANPEQPLDIEQQAMPQEQSLAEEPASASLSNVPLPKV